MSRISRTDEYRTESHLVHFKVSYSGNTDYTVISFKDRKEYTVRIDGATGFINWWNNDVPAHCIQAVKDFLAWQYKEYVIWHNADEWMKANLPLQDPPKWVEVA